MSICSAHQAPQADCPQCEITEEVLLQDPVFAQKVHEAEMAGEHTCVCGFVYYKTTDTCPKCGYPRL